LLPILAPFLIRVRNPHPATPAEKAMTLYVAIFETEPEAIEAVKSFSMSLATL
jgi:hypothetical protein